MSLLSELKAVKKSTFRKKRIGRGNASGWGTTAARGYKGQKARSGSKSRATFEGGQMPLWQRLPKFGFTPIDKVRFQLISLDQISQLPDPSQWPHKKNVENSDENSHQVQKDTVLKLTPQVLKDLGLVKKSSRDPVKILKGKQDFHRVCHVQVHALSASAKKAIESAGGSVEVISSC